MKKSVRSGDIGAVVRLTGVQRPAATVSGGAFEKSGVQGASVFGLRCAAADKPLQREYLLFEFLDLLARTQQNAALHIEFLARDQIEITQARLQRAAKGCRHVLARLLEARRNQCGKALRQRVDRLDIDHRSPRSCIETMILARIPVFWKIASFL